MHDFKNVASVILATSGTMFFYLNQVHCIWKIEFVAKHDSSSSFILSKTTDVFILAAEKVFSKVSAKVL